MLAMSVFICDRKRGYLTFCPSNCIDVQLNALKNVAGPDCSFDRVVVTPNSDILGSNPTGRMYFVIGVVYIYSSNPWGCSAVYACAVHY